MDIDASVEIWNFVSQYNINGLISCSTNSVQNHINNNELLIYPNPLSNGILNIELTQNNPIEIRSLDGKLMWKSLDSFNGTKITVHTQTWDSGIYFVYSNKHSVRSLIISE